MLRGLSNVRRRVEQLARHVPIQLRIPCPIHLAHTAFADLGGDGIRAEPGADGERHGCVYEGFRLIVAGGLCWV